ncbi:MAG TPA: hypothetical protein VF092_25225 [Longimicrobium sp.]
MRKLRMDLEQLHVESFATGGPGGRRGTVNGHATTVHPTNLGSCGYNTGGCNSCAATCAGGACASENQTYDGSCVPNVCPNSYDQACYTDGAPGGCFYPLQPPNGN